MRATKAAAGAAVAAFASAAEAALASTCVGSNDICFQWGAPEAAIRSDFGNVYFQLRAPTTYSWFALGSGSAMRGASIFVVYQNGDNNVTLSTRSGQGHFMPDFTARSDVELLPGSGITDGNMVANVRCNRCSDIDISSSSPWIAAWKAGAPLDSASPSANIMEHDGHTQFAVNLAQASIASDSNPFLSNLINTGTVGSGGNGPTPTGSSGLVVQQGSGQNKNLQNAHGIIMAIVFIGGYPLGASLIPLIGNWLLHASWQLLAFLGMWAGFGLGYTVATRDGSFCKDTHTQLGLAVCVLMVVQPVLGWIHHRQFVKTRSRGIFSHLHIWYGRAIMILGIVNGGLGLNATNQSASFVIAYSVLAGIVAVTYIGCIAVGVSKRRKQVAEKDVAS
ncbi:hypothetical protein E4U53_008098 [Claviceps sorghi]|nr:hypothetical protein E4U53_008098 [Claviceps sorghi]